VSGSDRRQNGVVLANDLRTDTRWPRFTHAVVDATPARSMLSFRLFLTEQNRAGLNLYATRPGAFTDQSIATGSMFAAYSSMALLAAAGQDRNHHLLRAVESNREIGIAIGILMAAGSSPSSNSSRDPRAASLRCERSTPAHGSNSSTTAARSAAGRPCIAPPPHGKSASRPARGPLAPTGRAVGIQAEQRAGPPRVTVRI